MNRAPSRNPSQHATPLRRLQRGYVVALGLIAALTIGSHVVIASTLHAHRHDALTLNTAGRQRMLSQRIVKDLELIAHEQTDHDEALFEEVHRDLALFREVHGHLREGSPAAGIAGPGRSIGPEAFPPLHDAFLAFFGAAEASLAALDAGQALPDPDGLLRAEARFMERMEAMVSAYQARSERKLGFMNRLHLLIGLALLVVLALEAGLLFRPLLRRIERQVTALSLAQERSELLATVAEHTRHAVALGEADGTLSWMNATAEAAFAGGDGDDAPRLADVAPAAIGERLEAAIRRQADLHIDEISHGLSSSAIDLVAVRGADGAALRFVLVLADLTERADRERLRRDVQRRAGQADVSATVLHNVGNTLNSLALAVESLDRTLKESRLPGLTRASEMIPLQEGEVGRFFAEDPRGRKMPAYLRQLGERLTAEQEALLGEAEALRGGVDHLKHVISRERATLDEDPTARADAREALDAAGLLEEAVRIYGATMGEEAVTLEIDAPPGLAVSSDRHVVLQVLGNLLTNAIQATLAEDAEAAPSVRLSAASLPDGRVCLEVRDQGCGIEPAHLAKLFESDFSTKRSGGGIGLCDSADAAGRLGGVLEARSPGPGRGATFRLLLPSAAAVAPCHQREAA